MDLNARRTTEADQLAGPLIATASAGLRAYSQIVFSHSRLVGALLLLATAIVPLTALYGLLAVALSLVVAKSFRLSRELTQSGLFAYSALLVGLGTSALLGPGVGSHALGFIGVVAAVLVTAALYSALGAIFGLPPLTVPFIAVFYLITTAARVIDASVSPLLADPSLFGLVLWQPLTDYLHSLGALFFLPRIDVGLIVLLALLVHSRIAVVLSLVGFTLAHVVAAQLSLVMDATLPLALGYNFILTSIALGGTWFVPSTSSFVLATSASLVCGLVAIGIAPILGVHGLPLLILPFNVTTFLFLYAMRQRSQDRTPKAIDFAIGTPEQNLNYYRTRVARFGARYTTRFRAPFLGRWICTQGIDGEPTHQGAWRNAFDFEVADLSGRTFTGDGTRVQDYLCYRLPVLATADGTVTRVLDGVQDNAVGELNLGQNWGNFVLLYHGPGVYSLVCHLAPGSVVVREGQFVRRSTPLGLCGNSGRSGRPHVHFQLQGSPTLGAPTLAAELHDVVLVSGDQEQLRSTHVVAQGELIRNLETNTALSGFPPMLDASVTFDVATDGATYRESITARVDLLGNHTLRSSNFGTITYYDDTGDLFRIYDTIGDRRSVLHLIQVAVPTVPLEPERRLSWSDAIPARLWRAWPIRILSDLWSPFSRDTAINVDYHSRREGSAIIVEGRATTLRGGSPTVESRASFDQRGLVHIAIRVKNRHYRVQRVDAEDPNAFA